MRVSGEPRNDSSMSIDTSASGSDAGEVEVPVNQLESILGPPRPYVFEVNEEVA